MKKRIIKLLNVLGVKGMVRDWRNALKILCFNYFTILGIKQAYNYKNIPIIIISFNQLYYLKQLITFLQNKQYNNIIIIDNNSTYKPLLDYFDSISNQIKIYKLDVNHGHLVFWKNKDLFKKYTRGYYVITDADIVPISDCPDDFLSLFKKLLNKNLQLTKVGFSLKIDDIPEYNNNKSKILDWEKKFGELRTSNGNFIADIDTTFALYRPGVIDYQSNFFYSAIRTKYPYTAQHGGWYIDYKNLTAEQKYYLKTANQSASWMVDEYGNVVSKLYKFAPVLNKAFLSAKFPVSLRVM